MSRLALATRDTLGILCKTVILGASADLPATRTRSHPDGDPRGDRVRSTVASKVCWQSRTGDAGKVASTIGARPSARRRSHTFGAVINHSRRTEVCRQRSATQQIDRKSISNPCIGVCWTMR